MKSKLQLLETIRKNGPSRPVDLARELEISPQALHRHLKALTQEGIIEARGSPPTTKYGLAGVPDFSAAFAWISAPKLEDSPKTSVSETRDVFAARLSPLKSLVKQGLDSEALPLLISVIGEVGNNSFDHNLGQWRDVPGCWFETQVTGNDVWVCIADRGQGILHSLERVDKNLTSDQLALNTAFERFISGRAPEQRGNGLKYVKKTILSEVGRGLVCASGIGRVEFGTKASCCADVVKKLTHIQGTLTLLAWRLK